MTVLGLETTSRINSVAAWNDDGLLAEVVSRNYQDLSRRLPRLIEVVLEQANLEGHAGLEAVAVSVGPGSFTGIRVGVSYARALAQALELPLAGVQTLEAVAAQSASHPGQTVVALLPSRGSHVYWQAFRSEEGVAVPAGEPCHDEVELAVSRLAEQPGAVHLCGEGVDRHRDLLAPHLPAHWTLSAPAQGTPRAATVARLGRRALVGGAPGEWREVLPLYLVASAAERKLAQQPTNARGK